MIKVLCYGQYFNYIRRQKMKKGSSRLEMMFKNIAYLLSRNLLEYKFHRVEKEYFKDIVKFLRQEKIISTHAEKRLISKRGFPDNINLDYMYFYPKFAALLNEKFVTPEYMFEKISKFHKTSKLPKKDREVLIPIMNDLAEMCKKM